MTPVLHILFLIELHRACIQSPTRLGAGLRLGVFGWAEKQTLDNLHCIDCLTGTILHGD